MHLLLRQTSSKKSPPSKKKLIILGYSLQMSLIKLKYGEHSLA